MRVTFYTRETAPHRCVSAHTCREGCEAHAKDPAEPGQYNIYCAACNWDSPPMIALRRKRRASVESAMRRGLPPLLRPPTQSRIPPALSDEEAGAVVLPRLWRREHFPEDKMLAPQVESRYLTSVGERQQDNGEWSCGCSGSGRSLVPCERHRLPLRDFNPDAMPLVTKGKEDEMAITKKAQAAQARKAEAAAATLEAQARAELAAPSEEQVAALVKALAEPAAESEIQKPATATLGESCPTCGHLINPRLRGLSPNEAQAQVARWKEQGRKARGTRLGRKATGTRAGGPEGGLRMTA